MLWLAKAIVIKLICQINYYYFTRITRWNITMLLTTDGDDYLLAIKGTNNVEDNNAFSKSEGAKNVGRDITEGAKDVVGNIAEKLQDIGK